MKTDITGYSDSELSLLCFNDEGLYKMVTARGATDETITEIVGEYFIYTREQLAELLQDCEDDREEH